MTFCQNDFLYSQVFKQNVTSTDCFPRVHRTVQISHDALKKESFFDRTNRNFIYFRYSICFPLY